MLKCRFTKMALAKLDKIELKDRPILRFVLGFSSFAFFIFILYNLVFWGRIYPGISIARVPVGSKTPEEAIALLSSTVKPPSSIFLISQTGTFEIPLDSIDFSYDFVSSVQAAYDLFRTGNTLFDLFDKIMGPRTKPQLGLRLYLNEEKLQEYLSVIVGQIAIEPIEPTAKLVEGQVVIDPGRNGLDVDTRTLRALIARNLAYLEQGPVFIPMNTIESKLTDEEKQRFKRRIVGLFEKSLVLNYEDQVYVYQEDGLFKLINPKQGYQEEEIIKLSREIANELNREAENPIFVFLPVGIEGKGKVKEFAPAKDGVEVEVELLREMIEENLRALETTNKKTASIEIPARSIPPKFRTEDVNSLGIEELIGVGSSRFTGSIQSRIHNIALAASKFNGILVAPDEVLSFNETLGDVSVYTGYKQAYIIKEGKTVLGDGGGVCQVSTTLFRAALDAGLPIIERRAHAYRVAYYEQDSLVGFDATVYAPTTDLKIKNNTPGHILIQTHTDTQNATLAFEIYGTSDSRVISTTKPVVTNVTPPPEDLYTDDPTLPEGTVKQIDWKAWGAKVWFDYRVERDGETIYEKRFYSNYQPWQAVFLRGTGLTN